MRNVYIGRNQHTAQLNKYEVKSRKFFYETYIENPQPGKKGEYYFTTANHIDITPGIPGETADNKDKDGLRRNNESHKSSWGIVIDGDKSKNLPGSVHPRLIHDTAVFCKINHIIYTSSSHDPTKEFYRWRLIVFCKFEGKDILGIQKSTVADLYKILNLPELIEESASYDLSHMWFLPIQSDHYESYRYFNGHDFPLSKAREIPVSEKSSTADRTVEDMIKLIQEGVEDTGLHIATRDFAYGQLRDGVKPGAVKGILRGLMSGYNLNDSRQKENFGTIDRTVDKAVIKIETEKSQNFTTKSLESILEEKRKEIKDVIPKELLKPGGILQDIMDMYYCNSIFYYPDLALITALSLWGGVMSNRIMSETYLRTHLYCFVTAGTGVGKNAIFTTINGFLNQSGDELKYNSLRDLCGSNEITSASALVAELEPEVFEENKNAQQQDTSQKLMILDEIGFIFERMKQTGNQEAIGTLNKLYTINCAKETSKHKKRHAKATKHNNIELFNPCLSIIGLSTKNKFWQGIDLENIDSGFFPRILLINIPKRSTRKMVEPYDIEKLTKKIFVLMKKYPKAKSPPIFKLTDMLRNRLHEWEDKLLNKHEQDTIDYSIYTRAEEFVYKLSLLHSSSLGLNYIDENSLDWSMKLTECILTYKIKESKLYIHESKLSEVSDKIIFKMKRYMINKKESKVTKEHMSKYIRRGFESRDYSDALAFLIDSEIIIRTEEQTSKKKTIFFQLTT